MSTKKVQRKKIKKLVAAFFIREGKFFTTEEYSKLGTSQPVMGVTINRIYGRYAPLLNELKNDETLVALVNQAAAVKEAAKPKPVPPLAPKVKPLTKAKPASKLGASTVEK
jgi:hypothetical protein